MNNKHPLVCRFGSLSDMILITPLLKNSILEATKCDLCHDQLGGPACQRACPHDALERVDLQSLSALEGVIAR